MSKQQNNSIKEYVRQLKQDLNLISQHKSSVIFTGLTGSGKGTLINYLTKNRRLYARTSQTGDMIIQLKQKLNYKDFITISSKMQSQTLIPQQISYKGQVFRDLPGFMDNRDDQKFIPQDITNSFFIHQVFQKTQNVKIAFVSSKNSLNDKAIQFILSLTQFSERFENIDEIVKSIFLVVTKVPIHLQIKHIKCILEKIVSDLKNEMKQNTRRILQEWIFNGENCIELFKVPQKQGPLNFSQVDNFNKKLKNIPYSPSPTIRNIISEYSSAKMIQLQEKWNHAISQICYELIKSSYENYLKKIQKIRMLNTAKSSLNYLRHKLDQLMGTENPQDFKNRLKNIPQLHAFGNSEFSSESKSQQLMGEFEEYYEFLQLFQKIHPEIHNTPKWKEPLYKIHHNISQIVSQPWQQIHGEDIHIKGFVVESASIQKKINFYNNKLTSPQTKGKVVIFAYFFIMNQDIQYPGGNVMIYTQYFIVEQRNVKIRLNGQNAKDYSVMTDDDNCHGQPGRPGQNAGNLLLKVYERCDNLEYFSVDLRGGRGGKGKNGGQIKLSQTNRLYINYLLQDRNLPTTQKKYLLYREDYKFSERNIISKIGEIFRILGTYNGQVVQFYSTQIDIENNLQNFAFTLGGVGGKPGNSGNLHIDIGDKIVQVIDKAEPSSNGEAHVQVYQGLYAKQMIFPNFRQQGREINIKSMIEQKRFEIQYKKIQQEMRLLCQKKKSRMRKMSSSTEIGINYSPQKQKQNIESNPWTADQLKNMVIEAQNQIQQEQEISTPLLYKKKYKEETEYFDEDLVIRQEDNEEEDYQNEDQSIKVQKIFKKNFINSETKISPQVKNFELRRGGTSNDLKQPPMNFIVRKQQRRQAIPIPTYQSRSTLQSYEESINEKSSKISGISRSNRTIKSISSSQQSSRTLTNRLLQPKKNNILQAKLNSQTDQSQGEIKSSTSISNSEMLLNKLKEQVPRWGKQMTKEVATDIGTGTFEKLAQRIINKVCQKALRTGFTMQKQVLKQFVQNALKSQTQKKLLAQLGILTGESFSKQIAKAAALKIQENIITNLGKEVIRDTAGILQRQALKHLGEDLAKVGVKRLGSQAAKQAQIQLAAKSLSSGTVYMQGMVEGLGKSILFQIFLSALLASGITDTWIIKPHFKSKKMDLKIYSEENIQQPEPHYDFTVEEMNLTQEEYTFFVSSFRQFHSVFANKT